MSDVDFKSSGLPEVARAEHVRKNVGAKRVIPYSYDATTDALTAFGGGFNLPSYDYVSVAYPTATSEVYTLKSGGSGGSTVTTITLTYTDSTKASLSTAAKA